MDPADELIRSLLLERGIVPPKEIERVASGRSGPDEPLESALFRAGLITSDQLVWLVNARSSRSQAPDRTGHREASHIERGSGTVPPSQAESGGANRSRTERFGFETGRVFGRYEIVEEIARGGMGIVYRARDRDLDRDVALKVLKYGEEASQKALLRFQRETRTTARLAHPHIVTIHDVGTVDGTPYFAMERVEGTSLDVLMEGDALQIRDGVRILAQVARAVAHAHERSILHRDLKPGNILVDREMHAKVTDFGLAKIVGLEEKVTKTGELVGTPYYMSPEQFEPQIEIDHRVDIYGVGVILYKLLTGRHPYEAKSLAELVTRMREASPKRPSRVASGVDPDLEAICMKAIARDRTQRYATAAELADDLENQLAGRPVQARNERRSPLLLVGGLVALLLLLLGLGFGVTTWLESRATAKREKEYKTRIRTARRALDDRRIDDALVALARAEELNPDATVLSLLRGRCYLSRGELLRARLAFDTVLEAEPRNETALRASLRTLLALGEKKKAEAILSEILVLSPEEASLWLQRAELRHARGDVEKAAIRKDVDAAVRHARGDADLLTRAAAFLVENLESEQAARLVLDQALAADPDHPRALIWKGRLLCRRKKLEDGLACFEKAIEASDDIPEAFFFRGQAFLYLGRIGRAETDLKRYLASDPTDEENVAGATNILGRLALDRDDYQGALDLLNKALRLDPELGQAYFNRYEAKRELNDVKGAFDDISAAIDLLPDVPEYRLERAKLGIALNKPMLVREDAEVAIEARPDDPEAYHYRGVAHLLTGRPEKAERDFLTALEKAGPDPSPTTLRNLVVIYMNPDDPARRDPKKALSYARRATRIAPEHYDPWELLATVYYKLERFGEAQKAMKKALALLPPGHPAEWELRQKLEEIEARQKQ